MEKSRADIKWCDLDCVRVSLDFITKNLECHKPVKLKTISFRSSFFMRARLLRDLNRYRFFARENYKLSPDERYDLVLWHKRVMDTVRAEEREGLNVKVPDHIRSIFWRSLQRIRAWPRHSQGTLPSEINTYTWIENPDAFEKFRLLAQVASLTQRSELQVKKSSKTAEKQRKEPSYDSYKLYKAVSRQLEAGHLAEKTMNMVLSVVKRILSDLTPQSELINLEKGRLYWTIGTLKLLYSKAIDQEQRELVLGCFFGDFVNAATEQFKKTNEFSRFLNCFAESVVMTHTKERNFALAFDLFNRFDALPQLRKTAKLTAPFFRHYAQKNEDPVDIVMKLMATFNYERGSAEESEATPAPKAVLEQLIQVLRRFGHVSMIKALDASVDPRWLLRERLKTVDSHDDLRPLFRRCAIDRKLYATVLKDPNMQYLWLKRALQIPFSNQRDYPEYSTPIACFTYWVHRFRMCGVKLHSSTYQNMYIAVRKKLVKATDDSLKGEALMLLARIVRCAAEDCVSIPSSVTDDLQALASGNLE